VARIFITGSSDFCQSYRGLGRAVTSRLMRLLKSHIAALLREQSAGHHLGKDSCASL
jgi:hypothetical protein